MMTVKQVSRLTGVSVRTLQFYDEIDLLKPATVTDAGYRMYDDHTLEVLQQILFFKELDFTLKEIKAIIENPGFDRDTAYMKQRELILIKRDRLNALLHMLDKLIKGEKCMEFDHFAMGEYFRILADFKMTHKEEIVKQLGSLECFDEMIADLKSRETEIAGMALDQYGSIENYTKAMEKNFQKFLTEGPSISPEDVSELTEKGEQITKRLTADLNKDPASAEIQSIVGDLIAFTNETNDGIDMGANYWPFMAETYSSNPVFIKATDQKYGIGASKFMGLSIKAYLERQ